MAGAVHFRKVKVGRRRTIDYFGIEVGLNVDLPPGTELVAGIWPEDLLAVGRQPCKVVVFDFDLDLPFGLDGRLHLGRGITRFEPLGSTEAVWLPGRGLQPARGSFMSGEHVTDTTSRLQDDLRLHFERFPVRRLRPEVGPEEQIVTSGSDGIEVAGGVTNDDNPESNPPGGSGAETGDVTSTEPPEVNGPETASGTPPANGIDESDAEGPGSPADSRDSAAGSARQPEGGELSVVDAQSGGGSNVGGAEGSARGDQQSAGSSDLAAGHDHSIDTGPAAEARVPTDDESTPAGSTKCAKPGADRFVLRPESDVELPPDPDETVADPTADTLTSEAAAASREGPDTNGSGVGSEGHVPAGTSLGTRPGVLTVKLMRRRGRVANYPSKAANELLQKGGVDPQYVGEWLADSPFNIAFERWYRQPKLRALAAAKGPFKRRRPGRIQEDVEGFDPALDDLVRGLVSLSLSANVDQARTRIHWCQSVLVDVEAAELMDQASIQLLEQQLDTALADSSQGLAARSACAVGKRWAGAIKRAMR